MQRHLAARACIFLFFHRWSTGLRIGHNASVQVPDPTCAAGRVSLPSPGNPQVCCAGYCGECTDYSRCHSVRGQDSTNACCASKVYAMRCGGGAPANTCLKSCSETVPPCIMDKPVQQSFHTRTASVDCNTAVEKWRLQVAAATNDGKAGTIPAPGPNPAAVFDAAVKANSAKHNIGEFSILLGDANGIVHKISGQGASTIPGSSDVNKPMQVYSAGKWTVSAALGAAVKQGTFAWDDRINNFIPFWSKNETDKRSKITFRHLLSHTSGLILSKGFLLAVGVPPAVVDQYETFGLAADVGLWNDAHTMEESARKVFDGSKPDAMPDPGSTYSYQETHYLVAQYAAMQATGSATWQDFFFKYWGAPLGLHREVVASDWSTTGEFLPKSDAYGYGFWVPAKTQAGEVPNPDGGSQLVASPCTFSRFLSSYLRSGDVMYGASFLDKEQIATPDPFGGGPETGYDGYALGHWTWHAAPSTIHHSVGYAGVVPMTSTTSDGKPFWAHLARHDFGGLAASLDFIADLIPALQTFMATSPTAQQDICP